MTTGFLTGCGPPRQGQPPGARVVPGGSVAWVRRVTLNELAMPGWTQQLKGQTVVENAIEGAKGGRSEAGAHV